MNRRNVVLGLSGLIAGAGALIGTGAFDTVEAERTVSVETAGDAGAFLRIGSAGQYAEQVVTDTEAVFEIDIGGATTDAGGQGVNQRARTRISDFVVLTNQGTQEVNGISLTVSGDGGILDIIDDGISSNLPLSPGQSTTFGVEIDLRDNSLQTVTDDYDIDEGAFDPVVTIIAEN